MGSEGLTHPVTSDVLLVGACDLGTRIGLALAELALFILACAACTWLLERPLLREALGLMRRRAIA